MVKTYLAAEHTQRKSALVRMPTGTGKTGVIAVVSHMLTAGRDAIVVTPWDALADQLVADVSEGFWNVIGQPTLPRGQVIRLLPSTVDERLAQVVPTTPTVWVCTTATLQGMQKKHKPAYEALAARCALAVVDEGHYEPAPTWADAVRGLQLPTVLFTATPYRNDYRFFDVDPEHTFQFSHEQAQADAVLRAPIFRTIDFDDAVAFVDALVPLVDLELGPDDRIIVRCASRNSVQQVAESLALRGQSVVAVHQRFTADSGSLLRPSVPDPKTTDARFWVHQFKLTEGIDDPRFRMLAVFEPFSNERAFVQQVGRVLRNPGSVTGATALIVGRADHFLRESWTAYSAFDAALGSAMPPAPADFALQQKFLYIDGRFRTGFDLDAAAAEDFTFDKKVRVGKVGGSFDLDAFDEALRQELEEEDFDWRSVPVSASNVRLYTYVKLEHSSILRRKAFVETSLGVCLVRVQGELLFFHDARGWSPKAFRTLPAVSADSLRQLYASNAAMSEVSLLNLDVGEHSPRRRSVRANALDLLAPDLAEFAQYPSTVKGRTSESTDQPAVARYVGFSRGRVSDTGSDTYEGFLQWTVELASLIGGVDRETPRVFDRWAEVIEPPDPTTPESLLLDVDPSLFVDASVDPPEPLVIDDVSIAVDNVGRFELIANGSPFVGEIAWNDEAKKYLIKSQDLEARFTMATSAGERRATTFVDYVNRDQLFRVVTAGDAKAYAVYVGGSFCRPRLPIAGRTKTNRLELMSVLEPSEALKLVRSEKGTKKTTKPKGWDPASLFGLIDGRGIGTDLHPHLKGFTTLICDDMGTEIADFIALDPVAKQIVMIHAKAFPKARPGSASALHEVSGQVVKNLEYMHPFFVRDPANLGRWGEPWKSDGAVVTSRLRGGPTTATQAWSTVRSALRDPAWSRSVWVVLGNGLSKRYIDADRNKQKPRAETIQVLYSLQGLWSQVSSVGAQLKIFCSP